MGAVALVVAAGRGERLGLGVPKALVPVGGRPMLEWSVDALRSVPEVSAIVVAVPPDAIGVIDVSDAATPRTITAPGGAARSDSVRAALRAAPEGDPVIVHDAARVLAGPALFTAVIEELERSGADCVVAAAPVTDTIKEVDGGDGVVSRTLDRSRLWAVQTPQGFRRSVLESVLDAPADVLAAATDDAWLVERAGGTVVVLPAPHDNLKITTPLDLRVAELLLAERDGGVR